MNVLRQPLWETCSRNFVVKSIIKVTVDEVKHVRILTSISPKNLLRHSSERGALTKVIQKKDEGALAVVGAPVIVLTINAGRFCAVQSESEGDQTAAGVRRESTETRYRSFLGISRVGDNTFQKVDVAADVKHSK